ncbi:MAG: tRNA 2-thiouridine(34) synthase MnmA [Granulosicoccaceae bacterium]|jgi:tRNA-specific 2-thiouridylase
MKAPEHTRVIIGISGGVDSSVAALLLKQQGYQVEGLFMKNWEEDDTAEHCSAEEDLRDARSVCEQLDIPLHTINFSAEYWERVFTHFLDEYRAGRTPNPDILCNREIKFRAFLDHALQQGADYIATGHYARRETRNHEHYLCTAHDQNKDQTYFLYLLGQHALQHSLFPLGELDKSEVRRIAEQHGFVNAGKKDSTGICFIGERNFREFLSRYLPARPGKIVTEEGTEIGIHEGLMYYTLGQRQGLGIGGRQDASGKPWFVAEKDLEHNQLIVVQGGDHPLLFKTSLRASQLHWVSGHAPALPLHCRAKTRYRQPAQACTVQGNGDDELIVHFDEPQRAMTPGQSVVFYLDTDCLGGGIINEAFNQQL